MVGRSVFTCLVATLAFSASMSAAAPVLPGSQIELLPVVGASLHAGAVVVSSDGAHVYAGYTYDVRSLSRDGVSGELTLVDVDAIHNVAIAISPDGAHVYVADADLQQLEIFERNAESGALDSVRTVTQESGGTETLDGILSLAVSPDGAFVYVTTTSSNGILVFERDAQTGALGTPPLAIDMTVTPTKIVFSPDGVHAYVANNTEEELRIYARSSDTGDLTLLDTLDELVFTVTDVPSSRFDVAISPSGERVEVTSAPEGTITAFDRDASSGALTFADELVLRPSGTSQTQQMRLVTGNSITWASSYAPPGLQPTSEARLDLFALSRDPATDDVLLIDSVTLVSAFLSFSSLALAPDEQHMYFGGYPSGVGGARLVPEPAATALASTAIGALLGLRGRRRKEHRAAG
jgi:6-phosphogluconolactonase (cycloisomerase 2 family)